MFTKELYIGNYEVIIHITESPVLSSSDSFLFGNPLIDDGFSFQKSNEDIGNSLKGHWLKIDIQDNKITLINDILGGFRTYYHKSESKIVISDDYNFVLEKGKIPYEKNDIEYQYWLKHRFTTGGSTFIKGLDKISPACVFTIDENGVSETSYFKNIERESNREDFREALYTDLSETFHLIKQTSEEKILLFSGGKDSCLLLQYMLDFKIPFKAVFFKITPINKFIAEDLHKVNEIAKNLNLNIDVIDINLNEITKSQKEEVLKKQIFDRHFSLLHYVGNQKLTQKYGNDIIIINGQSSDSILSFGPSEGDFLSYLRRYIMYKPKHFISKIATVLLSLKTRQKFLLPKTQKQSLLSLFDEFKYTRVIESSKSKKYYKYLEDYIDRITQNLTSFESKEMLVKIISFSQGSDNQVVINSAKEEKVSVIMPFATPNIIYNTVKYKNENLEIKEPKYVIKDILKKNFKFSYPKIASKTINNLPKNQALDFEQKIKIYVDKLFS